MRTALVSPRSLALSLLLAAPAAAFVACTNDDDGAGTAEAADAATGGDATTGKDATTGSDASGGDASTSDVTTTDANTDDGSTTDGSADASDAADAAIDPCIYVSSGTGSDGNDGGAGTPLKTIGAALAKFPADGGVGDGGAGNIGCVRVLPGTYDVANGETFPMNLPPGVALIGDEATRGDGTTKTAITGGLDGGSVGIVQPGPLTILSGFRVTASGPSGTFGVYVTQPGVQIKNNTFEANQVGSVVYVSGGKNGLYANDIFLNNQNVALIFRPGSEHNRVEGCVFRGNHYGVEMDTSSIGADLGGGDAGSVGGNVLACNTTNDFWSSTPSTFFAQNNQWDHIPPTAGNTSGGTDVYQGTAGVIALTDGGTVAADACP